MLFMKSFRFLPFLLLPHLSVPVAHAQQHLFDTLSSGVCSGLEKIYSEKIRVYAENKYGPGNYGESVSAVIVNSGLHRCSEQRVSNCLHALALTGADGLYALTKCLNSESQKIQKGSWWIAENDVLQILKDSDDSCVEQVWIFARRDWGTTRRACNL